MPESTPEPIRYTVRFPAALHHYVEIEARIPLQEYDREKQDVELFLPVWTPGSYLVREYSRHVESLTACGPRREPLAVTKTRKNRWLVKRPPAGHQLTICYLLYANDLTVRTNYRNDSFALLHGAATFISVVNGLARPHEVNVELPAGWAGTHCTLPCSGNSFRAASYDSLVDSPIVAGDASSHSFEMDGKPHILLNFGDSEAWQVEVAAEDIRKIVLKNREMWGELPYDRYLFFNLLTGGRGALEHGNSMVLMADRFTMRTRASYTAWLNLVSHEFFHVWNAKRLRPVELGPFDYENEVYTRNLWITEGFTEYYGPLTARRSNLSTVDEFLGTHGPPRQAGSPDSLTGWIEELQESPGRLQTPVATASFDAWIKLYRPDENSRNCSISYYTKGAVIAWLLDAKVRSATANAKTLDDIMRLAFQRYGGERGFSDEEFRSTAEEVAGIELKTWFTRVVDTTEELDYNEALSWFGLRFKPPAANAPRKAWLGVTVKTESHRLLAKEILRGTPADEAGISPGDELLAIGNYRVLPEQWSAALEHHRPQEVVSLLISRRDRLITIRVRLGEEPVRQWILEVDPDATPDQRQHLNDWLKPSNA